MMFSNYYFIQAKLEVILASIKEKNSYYAALIKIFIL